MALARLYAEAIIEESRTYESVPKKLKSKVAQALIDMGHEELITE